MRQLWTFPHGSAVHRAGGKVTMTPSSRRRVVMQLQNVKRSSRAKVKNAGRSKMRTAECLASSEQLVYAVSVESAGKTPRARSS
ncbi:unnamed protein product [Symbiodinium necroappetens]|uniref:Uncharacterized protein n=1 Tax=Symbiodinium necroappetens TaxID=1628268 RepID=A0A812JNS8_9DINO|nr:unnamed protein product [Symbiodinium necroappetens]